MTLKPITLTHLQAAALEDAANGTARGNDHSVMTISSLWRAGWITRAYRGGDSLREKHWRITDEGRKALETRLVK